MDDTIVDLYVNQQITIPNIAKRLDMWSNDVSTVLKRAGSKVGPRGKRKGCVPHNKDKPSPLKKDNTALIESGAYKLLCEVSIRTRVKRYLIEKNGHVCSICHNHEWNGLPIPLICDHVDGNSSNPDLSNFRLVCCNCDAQLPTYKSKNRGRGRTYDRKYYNDRVKMVV